MKYALVNVNLHYDRDIVHDWIRSVVVFTEIKNVGNAQAICITPGANQVIYVSNSNPPNDLDTAGEIYKMRLDGSVIGKFGKAGKLLKEFGTVNAIDCRGENTLYVGEVGNFRVQKLTIR